MPAALARLYDLADELCILAPWGWMDEVELIALRHPTTGESAFISITGSGEQHRSLTLYIGEDALHRFNLIQEAEFVGIDLSDQDVAGLVLEARQFQVSFESRSQLDKHDLQVIKTLNRKYRGHNWPMFRSFRPGYAPGPLDDLGIDWLTHAISQTLEVAPRIASGAVQNSRSTPRFQILGRERANANRWHDVWIDFDDRMHLFPSPPCDRALAKAVAARRETVEVEVAFELLPIVIGTRFHERTFPYVALCVDSGSGAILGFELLSVETTPHADLIAGVPDTFLRLWKKSGIKPSALHVTSTRTCMLLADVAEVLEIPLYRHKRLNTLSIALKGMKQAI